MQGIMEGELFDLKFCFTICASAYAFSMVGLFGFRFVGLGPYEWDGIQWQGAVMFTTFSTWVGKNTAIHSDGINKCITY